MDPGDSRRHLSSWCNLSVGPPLTLECPQANTMFESSGSLWKPRTELESYLDRCTQCRSVTVLGREEINVRRQGKCAQGFSQPQVVTIGSGHRSRASWLSFRLECEWFSLPVEFTLNLSAWHSSLVWSGFDWLHSSLFFPDLSLQPNCAGHFFHEHEY